MLRGIQQPRQQAPQRQREPGPLLPAALVRSAGRVLAGCEVVPVSLAVAFGHQARPDRLDAAVDTWVRDGLGRYHWPLRLLADLGGLISVTVLVVALVLACLAGRRWRGAVLACLAVPAAVAATEVVLKPLVGRTIGGNPSFPSGHATPLFRPAATRAGLLTGPSRPRLP